MKKLILILFLLFTAQVNAVTYYVNTASTGSGDGTTTATTGANAAWAAISEITGLSAGDFVYFNRGDTWHETDWSVTASGSAGSPITFGAYGAGDAPVISGGIDLTNGTSWSQTGGEDYWERTTTEEFRCLWVDGIRAKRGRVPATGYFVYGIDDGNELTKFTFTDGDIDPAWNVGKDEVNDVEVISYRKWASYRTKISDVNDETDIVTLTIARPSDRGYDDDFDATTGRYWCENVFEGVVAEGDWHLDMTNNKLYYYPRSGETMNTTTVIAGKVDNPVTLTDVDYITFENITFAYNDYTYWDVVRDWVSHGSFIVVNRGENIVINNCTIRNIAENAIRLFDCLNCSVTNTEIYDCGTGGIVSFLGVPSGNVLSNNTIYDIGSTSPETGGIYAHGHGYTISANTVYNSTFLGIHCLQAQGVAGLAVYDITPATFQPNAVTNNTVYDVMTELNDGGGVVISGYNIGSIVANNTIYNLVTTAMHLTDRADLNALYLDESVSGVSVHHNIVYNSNTGILVHDCPANTVRNNTFVASNFFELSVTGWGDLDEDRLRAGNVFKNNIVYNDNPDCQLWGIIEDGELGWCMAGASNNLYYTMAGERTEWNLAAVQSTYNIDLNALEADPQFVNIPTIDELITEGTAPPDIDEWTQSPGTQWAVVANEFVGSGNTANNFLSQEFNGVIGRTYTFSYTVVDNSLVGGHSGNQLSISGASIFGGQSLDSSVGAKSYDFLATNAVDPPDLRTILLLFATGGTITLDNISMKCVSFPQLLYVPNTGNENFHLRGNSPCLGIGRYPEEFPLGRNRYNRFGNFLKRRNR